MRLISRIALPSVGAAVVLATVFASGQAPAVFPALDVAVPVPPAPFTAGGRTHLVYELHVTNLSGRQTTLESVDIRDASARPGPPVVHLDGPALDAAVRRLGSPPDDPARRVLAGGQGLVVFVWATTAPGAVPASLTHRFTVRVEGVPLDIDGVTVRVPRRAPPVIGPPLRGDHWVAANGPDNGVDHRRTLLAVAGEGHIAQRFAIDWVRLYENGRTFKGDASKNASYRAYGADVLAVADGTVTGTTDSIPENVPDPVARAVPITPATISGNYVLQDIGGGAYAVYAHLQPGSLQVKKGDRVRRGQVLGRLGNSGNSTEPHLHFQVADRDSALDAEGIPYAIESWREEAAPEQATSWMIPVGNSLGLNPAGLAKWPGAKPVPKRAEMPLANAIVTFEGR